jgi:hypothetical protein
MFIAVDFETDLHSQAQGKCEVCDSEQNLQATEVTSMGLISL